MRWGLDGDIILYSVAFAAKDDPIAFACRSARSVCEQIMQQLGAEGAEIYLTGDGNYRLQYGCDTYPYKGTPDTRLMGWTAVVLSALLLGVTGSRAFSFLSLQPHFAQKYDLQASTNSRSRCSIPTMLVGVPKQVLVTGASGRTGFLVFQV